MVKTIADLEVNPNTPLASGIIETRSRIKNIGRMIQDKVDMSNIPTRRSQVKQTGVRKKPTD